MKTVNALEPEVGAAQLWEPEGQTMVKIDAPARRQSTFPLKACFNYVLHLMARSLPGGYSIRPFLHRLRGVKIERGVWIGDDVFLDGGHPEALEIREDAAIAMRCTIIGHTKGAGKVIIGKGAIIGVGSTIVCSSGKTLTIGEGAVVAAGSTVSNDIPAYTLCGPPRIQMYAKVTVPFLDVDTLEEFRRGLKPLGARHQQTDSNAKPEGEESSSVSNAK